MWSANIYGDMTVLLIRGNEFEKMLEVLNFLVKSLDAVVGVINPNRLQEIFAACLDRGHIPGALVSCCFCFFYKIANSKWIYSLSYHAGGGVCPRIRILKCTYAYTFMPVCAELIDQWARATARVVICTRACTYIVTNSISINTHSSSIHSLNYFLHF